MRLGQLERTILVNAPPQGIHGGLRIEDPAGQRSGQQGYLRAAKKLAGVGLIVRVPIREAVRASDPRREEPFFRDGRFWLNPDTSRRHLVKRIYVWATPFGEAIAQIYGTELARGKAIRWKMDNLDLARRYATMHPVDESRHRDAIESLASMLLEEPEDQARHVFREWFPEEGMTTELKTRWRCSAQLARRENPSLGSAGLLSKAIKIYGSEEGTGALRAKAGPLPGEPTTSGPRFQRIDLVGNRLTPAGRQAAARSKSQGAVPLG